MSNQKFASFAPADMKESSGLWDNSDAVVVGGRFTAEAPDGYTAEGSPLFAVLDFELAGTGTPEERRASQSYSLGASAGANFTVSEDGAGLIPNSENSELRKDSKFGSLMGSFQTEGVPEAILRGGDITKLIGLNGHWKRIADKERSFTNDRKGANGKSTKFPPSTLLCTKVISLPGAGVVATKAATTTATVAAPAADAAFDLDTTTFGYLSEVLAAKGGKVQRSQITLLVSQKAMKDANRQEIAKRAAEESFLAAMTAAGVLSYDPASKPQVVLAVAA